MLQLTTTTADDAIAMRIGRPPTGWAGPAGRGAGVSAQASRMRLAPVDDADRRRTARVRQVRSAKLLDMAMGRTVVGQTVDVSATGMRLVLAGGAGLRVGEVLGVHVGPGRIGDRATARRQMVPVRIVWVNQNPAIPGRTEVGVEFASGVGAQRDAA